MADRVAIQYVAHSHVIIFICQAALFPCTTLLPKKAQRPGLHHINNFFIFIK
ncbi:hypothetical protein D083_1457 [Dickeya solani RNS 08.23.3.1.A]|nr:hypothetical protein D083_1457 [Dickeya solani RNS 08.23.3.1.A]